MEKLLVVIFTSLTIVFSLFGLPSSAQAKTCYDQNGHKICLEHVQRSAKYHWQYKVRSTIDDQQQPLIWYDCRDRTQTSNAGEFKGIIEKFAPNGVGAKVCKLVDR
ncbi:MAG: hypothetical protein AAGH78_04450 [Cyanobacteria bacterium P01_H01_bin.58]